VLWGILWKAIDGAGVHGAGPFLITVSMISSLNLTGGTFKDTWWWCKLVAVMVGTAIWNVWTISWVEDLV
jgi:hypothetical protein